MKEWYCQETKNEKNWLNGQVHKQLPFFQEEKIPTE